MRAGAVLPWAGRAAPFAVPAIEARQELAALLLRYGVLGAALWGLGTSVWGRWPWVSARGSHMDLASAPHSPCAQSRQRFLLAAALAAGALRQ